MMAWAEERSRTLGHILLAAFVGFLGWYFCASYIGRQFTWRVEEKILTGHDDLFAVDGPGNGSRAAVGRFGAIILSRDGGKTWQERASGTSRTLSAIFFGDPQHGFAVGSGGTIVATGDGGTTWRTQTSGTKEQLLGIYASDAKTAHVVGAFGTLLSTSDGGARWRKQPLPWRSLIPRITRDIGILEPNLNAIYFVNPETGWIVGEFGLVLTTVDGGKTWISRTYGNNHPQLFDVVFRDPLTGWSVGQQGIVLRTNDGGRNWRTIDIGTRRNLYGISFEGERGLIVGEGIALASENNGGSWKSLASAPGARWLSEAEISGRQAVVVGQAGTVRVLDLNAKKFRRETTLR